MATSSGLENHHISILTKERKQNARDEYKKFLVRETGRMDEKYCRNLGVGMKRT